MFSGHNLAMARAPEMVALIIDNDFDIITGVVVRHKAT